jgi:GntR family transcriptional regulator/MocR family aminotransferase
MTDSFATRLGVVLDRTMPLSLQDQLCGVLREAVLSGQLARGARLPSWEALASQLGVARGTVRAAYDRLTDERLIRSAGAAGTFVTDTLPRDMPEGMAIAPPMREFFPTFSSPPLPFQMGVPAHDAFPAKLWARLATRAARWHASQPPTYPDPRGQPSLRQQIASYLGMARGIRATPDQIIVTNGYRTALNLVIRCLSLQGRTAWLEEPGFSIARIALDLAGVATVPVPVDGQGILVERGIELAPRAALAVVTPSQQAPLGMMLSRERRVALLRWANSADAWIVEDDYLGELQLDGRTAPALAADDEHGRVIHIGTFSKSISPHVGLGFLMVPAKLAEQVGNVAAYIDPAPGSLSQQLVAAFMAEGHFMRHLRKMKRLYRSRREALMAHLADLPHIPIGCLALLIKLPDGVSDTAICREAHDCGIAPTPLSSWFSTHITATRGLILCVTNSPADQLAKTTGVLRTLLAKHA